MRTLVLEQRDTVGGATVSETVWPGYTVSVASYVCSLLDPHIVADLELHRFGYSVYRKEPASFTPLEDGHSLLLGADTSSNAREIAAFDPRDVAGAIALEREAAKLGSLLADRFMDDDPRFDRFNDETQATLRGSAAAFVERFVNTPVLAATFATDGVIGTYAGPRDDGTAYVLAHHWAGRALGVQGAWGFVHGGMGSLSQALAEAALAAGAHIRTGAEAVAIEQHGMCADAVVLASGERLRADAIVSNADPVSTFTALVQDAAYPAPFARRLREWRTNGASFKLNLALGELPNFTARPHRCVEPHHRATIHIAPTIDYVQRACNDARTGGAAREPMLECFLQTPTEPELAPPGKHILSIFAQFYPHDRPDRAWAPNDRETIADTIVATLARYAPNVPSAIEARQILAAPDLAERFGLRGGHIFHGELLPGQIFEERFATRTPLVGLYLCGSGAHPGGCVSGYPGRRAAKAITADFAETHNQRRMYGATAARPGTHRP